MSVLARATLQCCKWSRASIPMDAEFFLPYILCFNHGHPAHSCLTYEAEAVSLLSRSMAGTCLCSRVNNIPRQELSLFLQTKIFGGSGQDGLQAGALLHTRAS
eukprot:1144633-Pelagomonas_calceolata.AAC.2